jgi:hypothetical protein
MKLIQKLSTVLCSILVFFPTLLWSTVLIGPDTCTINDDCQSAIEIANVMSDQSYVCLAGCNMYASPDTLLDNCQMGDFPTVWYRVAVDHIATIINIEVYSNDIESPVISLFKSISGCDILDQVNLTNTNLTCIIGSDGVAKAIGTSIDTNAIYYIAVSSMISIGGNFDVCQYPIWRKCMCFGPNA